MLNKRVTFFISVVESGSFSKAAKDLYLSQSAISQQILQLEEDMGVCLLDRTGYRPSLTEAGRYFYEQSKKIIENYKIVEEKTKQIGDSKKKKIRIGITGPIEKESLPLIINMYKKQYGDVFIEVKKIKFGNGVKQLEDKNLDICFGISNDFRKSEKISIVKLLKHQVCVICSKDNPLSTKKSIKSKEIANEPIISFKKSFGELFYLDFINSFKKDGINPKIVQEVDELEELILAVKINQGIAFISKEVIDYNDEVCVIDILNTHHHAEFCVGYLTDVENKYVKDFIEVVKTYFTKNYKKKL